MECTIPSPAHIQNTTIEPKFPCKCGKSTLEQEKKYCMSAEDVPKEKGDDSFLTFIFKNSRS